MEKNKKSFYRLVLATLVAVYLLILVGGIVRSTGSGMGCPDWPKCFGAWVPPTSVSELPENYKEIYARYREKKNHRFAKYLAAFGMDQTADRLLHDKSVLIERDFNPTNTLIEYINRLVGVTIGLLIFSVFLYSLKFIRQEPRLTTIALISLITVGIQGWLGSFVVSSNLTPWTITIHMFLALLIVGLLIYLMVKSDNLSVTLQSPLAFWWLIACISVLLVQILLGTQVREAIDSVSATLPRDGWIAAIETDFIIHRSFSWIILLLHIGLILKLRKTQGSKVFPLALILLILGTILTGMGMAYFAVPPFLQPIHLLLATVTFGVQFYFLLKLNQKQKVALAT